MTLPVYTQLDLKRAVYSFRQSVVISGSTYTLDTELANEFVTSASIAGSVTINLANLSTIPTGALWRGILRFSYTSGTVSWFTGNTGYTVKWDGGTQMSLTAGEQEAVIIEAAAGSSIIEIASLRGRT